MNEKRLLQALNAFVKSIDPDLSVAYGDEFFYNRETCIIEVALMMDWKTDTFYRALIEMYDPKVDLEPFIWSLLHEIGHHETDSMSEEEETDSLFLRSICQMVDIDQAEKIYFNLPEEKEATLWAIEYAENNLDTLNKWIEKFAKC